MFIKVNKLTKGFYEVNGMKVMAKNAQKALGIYLSIHSSGSRVVTG